MDAKTSFNLKLYPAQNGYIAKINVSNDDFKKMNVGSINASNSGITTVVILDRSGSMGNSVPLLVNKILPGVFETLCYSKTDRIVLITFDDLPNIYDTDIDALKKANITCGGSTYMSKAINALMNYSKLLQINKLRILSLSDGELHDQAETLNCSAKLSALLKNKCVVNSQAVRFFTSSNQPDTRGLSSVLQLNTVNKPKLIDVRSDLDYHIIVKMIADLFMDDGLSSSVYLKATKNLFKVTPWSQPSDTINLIEGENTFWLDSKPDEIMIHDGNSKIKMNIPISECDSVNINNYNTILKTKIDFYIDQLKVLKVVNMNNANDEIANILKYFTDLERDMEAKDFDLTKLISNNGLRGRIDYFNNVIQKRKRSAIQRMAEIANDDRVAKLNSAQQAEYLRNVEVTHTSKGLARRALNNGIDFSVTARQEVKNMHKHLAELKDIDDSKHQESFYSQETTLSGIRAVCELVDKNLIDDLEVNDILKLINIVGVACTSVTGDFPDAMCYRIDQIFYGCYISISDILMAHVTSKGQALKAVGTQQDIINVIPIFDDNRIHLFLKKYAPSILEYTCSVGMRRVIADVPLTYSYTVCAGIWKAVEDLNSVKSDININTFVRLVKTYEIAIGGYFNHVMEHIKDQDVNLSYYIANNGITNMISPLIKLINTNNTKYNSKILRALYNYEVWQAVKRLFKKNDNADILMNNALNKVLGIDFDTNKTQTKPLFEAESDTKFYDNYHIDNEEFDKMVKAFWYVDYVTLLPELITGAYHKNPLEYIKNIPKMNEKSICTALDINYDLKTFQFYNIVQALMYTTKNDRVDSDNSIMKIVDVANRENAEKLVREYVKKQYVNKYQSDLTNKYRLEREELTKILVNAMGEAKTVDEVVQLFNNGMQKGTSQSTVKILNDSSQGFVELRNKLFDLNSNVPIRIEKLRIFLLGRDLNGNNVWNGGNVLPTELKPYEQLFTKLNAVESWTKLKEEYMERNIHIYRELMNRHGHHNGKRSYWALGYQTLEKMIADISHEEWMKYCELHTDCCGVDRI